MSTKAELLIRNELAYQVTKGATAEKDAQQSLGDFLVYLKVHLDRTFEAYSGFPIEESHKRAEAEVVKVGALVHAYLNSRP